MKPFQKICKTFYTLEITLAESQYFGHPRPTAKERDSVRLPGIEALKREFQGTRKNQWANNLRNNLSGTPASGKVPLWWVPNWPGDYADFFSRGWYISTNFATPA